ncbi:taperin [Rana temporaria]|uniref:taperin n=1 Tax=Rana temporaria TaxID=8407 RepID=UPI001AAD052F|nr:taperin [Rana temporaria]
MAVSGDTKSWSRLEPGKMPAWKLEVLERKRQKMASGGGVLSSRGKDVSPSRHSRKGSPERLVLQDSLGPLHENPFIKLEHERRRRRPQHHHHHPSSAGRATSPIRHLLDIYGHVPGIRTIRAENIIIIESDPGYFNQTSHVAGTGADPVEELLAKRGSKVAEIRASEVVIYEPDLPVREPIRKYQVAPSKEPLDHNEVLEEAGRVSRLMEKFDHGHSKPIRSRSWENLLERDNKPALLPKPTFADLQGHAPQNKAPKRSGELSPSSASILEEDGKRFPLNNPSWLPSKAPAVHSLPDPGLFHKRPPSPITPPAISPSSLAPMSPCYDTPTDEKLVSPIVATVREKFEAGYTNHHPLSKLMNNAQKTGGNTILVNPKAASLSKARPSDATVKSSLPLTNGHVDPSEVNAKTSSAITIQDLLSKSKRPRATPTRRSSEGSGVVPSPVYDSTNELPKGANDWRPNSEANRPKNSIPPLSSASHSESSSHNHCDNSFTSATPNQLMKVSFPTSSNDSFEIRPAPKPDLSKIADGDIQAKALANIRMQSKNSFVFIPKKRQDPSAPATGSAARVATKDQPKVQVSASTFNGPKLDSTDSLGENGVRVKEVVKVEERIEPVPSSVAFKSSSVPSLSDFDWKSGLLPSKSVEGQSFTDIGAELEYLSSVNEGDAVDILTVPVTKIHEDLAKADIPITNIDDIVNADDQELSKEAKPTSKLPKDPTSASYRPHASLSSVRTKGTNTFTIIPKRKSVTENEAFRTPVVDEEDDDDDTSSKRKSSDGFEAPYSEIGALLKKRFPTVDEIQVIGGYQSLSKSCLLKNGSTRKKMKISFNEQNIHTMFEYPSETSLVATAEEEINDASGSESEEEEKTSGLFIPRATFGSSGTTSNGLQAKSISGLSSYTPKHSVQYSKWQDEKTQARSASPDSADNEGMLTPDYGDSHSDFRSDSALYF